MEHNHEKGSLKMPHAAISCMCTTSPAEVPLLAASDLQHALDLIIV